MMMVGSGSIGWLCWSRVGGVVAKRVEVDWGRGGCAEGWGRMGWVC